jgi:Dolichyl-phosphate-mannose-protein mannosyltransferase
MVKNYRSLLIAFISAWFIVNLLQAAYTEVIADEAYYWLYSKCLAWGYFDHPPLIALLVKVSSLFFSGNLGIRFMTVLMQSFTILLIWKIINDDKPDPAKVYSFIIIICAIPVFSIYGFITTPDAPLLFFTAFFLYGYKEFLFDQSWKNILMLSVGITGLVYSKYHGVLVAGFVILSNIRLLKQYKLWIAGLFSLVFLLPHIWWQVSNDFPTLKFQMVERSESFRWVYLLEYLPNQMAVFNPFILGAVLFLFFRKRPDDIFARALYFLIFGFLGFFGLTAFRGHVEPHWTASIAVPMIILLYRGSSENQVIFRFLRRAALPIVFLLLVGRVLFVTDLPFVKNLGYAGKREEIKSIESVAKDLPVLFAGTYQYSSLYMFFTGKEAFTISSLYSRLTQFDIWQPEKKYNNRKVFVFAPDKKLLGMHARDRLKTKGFMVDSLQTVNRIKVELNPQLKRICSGDSLSLLVTLTNPYDFDINFNHREFPVEMCMAFVKYEEIDLFPVNLSEKLLILRRGETCSRSFTTVVPELQPGSYHFGICLQTLLGPVINNSFSVIKIEKK